MSKHREKNERIKRKYALYLEDAQRMSRKSVDQALAAIAHFEAVNGHRDFAAFHIEQARRYKRKLETTPVRQTGKPVARATAASRLKAVRRFFVWLADQPGYKSKIAYCDADYFNPSRHDQRIASATRERPGPSLDQIRHVLNTMPSGTDIEKRDRTLIAFTILTGARDDAIASFRLKHVDLTRRRLDQDARDVRTKYRKSFPTWFFPVGDEIEAIVADWIAHLRASLHYGPDDPLFPKTRIVLNADHQFAPAGLERTAWANADPIRRIFREAFEAAGLPYFNPHSFRKTLASLGERLCSTPEDFKAWSQNLGHEQVMTTLTSYGKVAPHRQAELIDRLRDRTRNGGETMPDAETIARVLDHLRRHASV